MIKFSIITTREFKDWKEFEDYCHDMGCLNAIPPDCVAQLLDPQNTGDKRWYRQAQYSTFEPANKTTVKTEYFAYDATSDRQKITCGHSGVRIDDDPESRSHAGAG